jgi:hypothetical protein
MMHASECARDQEIDCGSFITDSCTFDLYPCCWRSMFEVVGDISASRRYVQVSMLLLSEEPQSLWTVLSGFTITN